MIYSSKLEIIVISSFGVKVCFVVYYSGVDDILIIKKV